MKILLQKIFSFTLSLLVLFSTLSFTVEKHFCGDFLVDISFKGVTSKCEMVHSEQNKSNCCKDEVVILEGQDILQQQVLKDVTFKTQQFLVAYIDYSIEKNNFSNNENFYFETTPPPKLSKKFQVCYQCFLI